MPKKAEAFEIYCPKCDYRKKVFSFSEGVRAGTEHFQKQNKLGHYGHLVTDTTQPGPQENPAARARKARKNPPRQNPPFPPGYKQVYFRLGRIEGQKDPSGADSHPCGARCRKARHWFRHGFKPGARLYQSPDGKTLMIRGK